MGSTERNGGPGVLQRTLAVLDAFGHEGPALALTTIADRAGLPKPTAHRLLAQLCQERLVERDSDGHYRLGLRLFELGARVPQHRTLSDAALPIMADLHEVTKARIHLAVLDGVDVVYVEIIGGAGITVASRPGGRLPAHATGVGKVMLAYSAAAVVRTRMEAGLPRLTPRTIATPGDLTRELRRIRTVGMALDVEEAHLGVSCVAAPVFGADRKIRAGLSITGRTGNVDALTLGPAVRTAAFTLSRELRAAGL